MTIITIWGLCAAISLTFLLRDTSKPKPIEIFMCILFAHFIAVLATVYVFDQFLKYRRNV